MKNNHKEDQINFAKEAGFMFWETIIVIAAFYALLIIGAIVYTQCRDYVDASKALEYATKKYNEAVYNDMILSKTTEASWHEKQSELRPWKR